MAICMLLISLSVKRPARAAEFSYPVSSQGYRKEDMREPLFKEKEKDDAGGLMSSGGYSDLGWRNSTSAGNYYQDLVSVY